MSENARNMLHEVMEQQTVSIAKIGIIASLNAITLVLACANPSGSRYNPRLSVIDNIHLPPTLLSRFDLIYLILDKADEQTDRRLAKHIVALHFEDPENSEQDVIDLPTLTAYVSYARKHIHPQLSDEAAEELTRGYVEMRRREQKWWRSKNRANKKDLEPSLMEVNRQDHQLTHQNGGGLMTDEQMELLRKQISVYATICEQLVEMHKAITAQQDVVGGNFYCDPRMTYPGNKITSRHRWIPTAVQLQILERFFDEGSGTHSKQKIKDITTELSQHGQISETNVYNWFQNRRARSKRKQLVVAAESEDMECSKEKKMKPAESANIPENTRPRDNDDVYFHNPELHCLEKPPFPSDRSLRSYGISFGHLGVRERVPRSNQLTSKMGEQ